MVGHWESSTNSEGKNERKKELKKKERQNERKRERENEGKREREKECVGVGGWAEWLGGLCDAVLAWACMPMNVMFE